MLVYFDLPDFDFITRKGFFHCCFELLEATYICICIIAWSITV